MNKLKQYDKSTDGQPSLEKQVLALNVLSKLTKHFAANPDFKSLINIIMLSLSGQFSTPNSFISLWDPTTNFDKVIYFGTGKLRENAKINGLLQLETLGEYFAANHDPIWISDLELNDESNDIKQNLLESNIKIIAPIFHNYRLLGIIGLGEKIGGKLLGKIESELFATFINTISPLIANSFLYIELQESEKNYRSLVENISDGVITTDLNETILFVNESSCKILGYTTSELIGKDIRQIFNKENQNIIIEETKKRIKKKHSKYELTLKRQDGQIIQIFVSAAPLLDSNGNVYGAIGILTDVTNIKKVECEKRELREKLSRAKRMESLGVLAGGIAHDLNNILGPLVAYPELIKMKLPPESPVINDIIKIENSAQRAADVVQDLLTMARRGRYDMIPVDLNEVIDSYLQSPDFFNIRSKSPNVILDIKLDSQLPEVHGSPSHLSKIVMNLVINALDAMPHGGQLVIKTESRNIEKLVSGYDNIKRGRYIILTISDTGVGISEKDYMRLFEPFYSKKEMGRSGSGLGLAIVYGVVKDHNGYIDVQSEVSRGSNFIVYLPEVEIMTVVAKEKIIDIRGSEKILIVDDLAEQRELAASVLSSLGYDVEVAAEGKEAVEYLKNNSVDVVVLDMIMEDNFDGLDTYREIIKNHPGQKAIIASGFSETDRVKEAQRLGVGKYVRKPYNMQKIGMAIREVLVS